MKKANNIKLKGRTYYSDFIAPNGKRVRKSLGRDYNAAIIKLGQLMADTQSMVSQDSPEPESIAKGKSYKQAVDEFIYSRYGVSGAWDTVMKSKGQNAQWHTCLVILKKFKQHNHLKTVNAAEFKHFQRFIDSYSKKLKAQTINKYIQFLKAFFEYCENMDWIVKSKARRLKPRKTVKPIRYQFNDSELKKIQDNAQGENRLFIDLMYEIGLRPTEMYNLTKDDFIDQCVRIYRKKTKDYLYIPISDRAQEIVDSINTQKLFPEAHQEAESKTWREQILKYVQAQFDHSYVRERNIRMHTFRHTFAMNKLSAGVPKEVIQALLGHESVKTTEVYANHMPKEQLRKYL